MYQDRTIALDFIRAIAVTSVLAVHFFMHCGFYSTPCTGISMTIAMVLRTQLMACVPLFLLLTGYLQKGKVWSIRYYKGLLSILLTYGVASVFCSLFRAGYDGGSWSAKTCLRGICAFSAAPYAWYIELYIGLFLLIPFLNTLWRALPGKYAKWTLLISVFFMSIAPSLNVISLHFGWQAVPGRWVGLYPAAYYFVGCYLEEVDCRRYWKHFLFLDLFSVVCGSILHIYQSHGGYVKFLALTYWDGVFPFLCAVSSFVVLSCWTPRRVSAVLKKEITQIAKLSLPVFLLSWIPDRIIYDILCTKISDFSHRLPWAVITIPVVLVSSVLLAKMVMWLQENITRLCAKIFSRIVRKNITAEK